MLVQINADSNIAGGTELKARVEAMVVNALSRFGDQVTRIEVHLSDENGPDKSGAKDKRCSMELRLAGHQPIAASHLAATIDQAVAGAIDKTKRQLDSTLGRLADRA